MSFSITHNRNYIRATDLFIFVDKVHKKYSSINLILKKKIDKSIIVYKFSNKNVNEEIIKKSSATCIVCQNNKKITYLFCSTKKKIKSRYSFDEIMLKKFFKIEKDKMKITFNDKSELEGIEILISLNKKLNEILFPNKKKWIISRISLNKKINQSLKKNLTIKIKNYKKNNYTISDIYDNKILVGNLYFNLK